MWLFTEVGFFSVVRKPADEDARTLRQRSGGHRHIWKWRVCGREGNHHPTWGSILILSQGESRQHGGPHNELEVLMLPPDPIYVQQIKQ